MITKSCSAIFFFRAMFSSLHSCVSFVHLSMASCILANESSRICVQSSSLWVVVFSNTFELLLEKD